MVVKLNPKIRNAILELLNEYIKRNKEKDKDHTNLPILVSITRKGYWLFRMLFDEYEEHKWELAENDPLHVFGEFEIYSDRYMTKYWMGLYQMIRTRRLLNCYLKTGRSCYLTML